MTEVQALDEFFRTQHFRTCERFDCGAAADYLLTRCGRYGRELQTFVCEACLARHLRDDDIARTKPRWTPLSTTSKKRSKTMTLSAQARMDLGREHELTKDEQEVMRETFRTLYDACAANNVKAANDDRAAELEAALVRYLLDSRNL